jgi:hypothetical protein
MSNEHDLERAVADKMRAISPPDKNDDFFYQDLEGDFVEFFEERDAYYAEYVDRRLTVYRSRNTHNVIGAKLSQVSELLENAPGIRLEVRDDAVSLEVLFKASCWTAETKIEDATHVLYKRVNEIASRMHRRAKLCVA